jgi:hypothetical protein
VPTTDGPIVAGTVLAALRVYEVPNRAEVLFTRSPLGRLRLYSKVEEANLLAVIILPADGSLRGFTFGAKKRWPLIVDDLPGGAAAFWLVLADTVESLLAGQPNFAEAEAKFETAVIAAKEAGVKFEQEMAKANLVVNPPEKSTTRVTVKELLTAMKSMSAAMNSSEQARQAQNQASEARATVEQLRTAAAQAAAQAGAEIAGTASFGTVAGTITFEILQRLLRTTRLIQQGQVLIVNGRTTDATLKLEK